MATCLIKKIVNFKFLTKNRGIISRCASDLWTPDYLDCMKPKIPQYPTAYIRLRGYDYPVLEQYQKLIHIMAENMELDIEDSYALPAKKWKVVKFKPRSSNAETEYELNHYERNFVMGDLSSPTFPIFVRMLEAALPEGVTLNIEEWRPEIEELRYVPDKQLMDMRSELQSLQKPKK